MKIQKWHILFLFIPHILIWLHRHKIPHFNPWMIWLWPLQVHFGGRCDSFEARKVQSYALFFVHPLVQSITTRWRLLARIQYPTCWPIHVISIPSSHRNGWTPLHSAAKSGHEKICKLLIEKTNNKNHADKKGRTPLHIAAFYGHFKACERFVDNLINSVEELHKYPLEPKDQNGRTPLHR